MTIQEMKIGDHASVLKLFQKQMFISLLVLQVI